MSVRELARRISLNPSHLSKIERGLANPSVGSLWVISDELKIPVAELFSEASPVTGNIPASASSEVHEIELDYGAAPIPVVKPDSRETLRMDGVEFQRLTPHNDAVIEFMEVRHDVGAGDPEAYRHRGREYGLLLRGRLLVEVGFNKYVLEPGCSIAYESSNPHRIINVGDEPAVAVWVVIGRNQL